jgi:hypothetical protein
MPMFGELNDNRRMPRPPMEREQRGGNGYARPNPDRQAPARPRPQGPSNQELYDMLGLNRDGTLKQDMAPMPMMPDPRMPYNPDGPPRMMPLPVTPDTPRGMKPMPYYPEGRDGAGGENPRLMALRRMLGM